MILPNVVLSYTSCLFFLITASITDIRTRKIPNRLTLVGILVGILLWCVLVPGMRIEKSVFAIILFFVGMLPGLGMGDIKLIMCIGLWGNPFWAMIETAVASIGVLIVRLSQKPLLTQIQIMHGLKHPFPIKEQIKKTENNTVSFAPYLLAAYILVEGGKNLWFALSKAS